MGPDCLFGLADRTDPAFDRIKGGSHLRPGSNHAGTVHGQQGGHEIEWRRVPVREANAAGIDPNRHVVASGRDMGDAGSGADRRGIGSREP